MFIGNSNLKIINDNAFGYANNSSNKTKKLKSIMIYNSAIETLGRNLLPWKKLELIDIRYTPANCNPAVNLNFYNLSYFL
jgi:hypothetical protein